MPCEPSSLGLVPQLRGRGATPEACPGLATGLCSLVVIMGTRGTPRPLAYEKGMQLLKSQSLEQEKMQGLFVLKLS